MTCLISECWLVEKFCLFTYLPTYLFTYSCTTSFCKIFETVLLTPSLEYLLRLLAASLTLNKNTLEESKGTTYYVHLTSSEGIYLQGHNRPTQRQRIYVIHPNLLECQKKGAVPLWSYTPPLFFVFLGPHLQHVQVPRLGIESELQLQAYTIATATLDLSSICNLHRSSQQS